MSKNLRGCRKTSQALELDRKKDSMMMMMSVREAIETAMDVDACPACGDTGRVQVYIEHTDTDRTLHVEECHDCGEESN